MTSPYDISLNNAIDQLKKGKEIILCIPLQATGSVPTPLNSRMTITEEDNFFGTVGGGAMEHQVLEESKELIGNKTKVWSVVKYKMDGISANSDKMTCGGSVDVLIEKFFPKDIKLFQEYDKCRKDRLSILDIIDIPNDENIEPIHLVVLFQGDKNIIYCSDKYESVSLHHPNIDSILDEVIKNRKQYFESNLFITPIIPKPVIYLYGAGTCGISLCDAALLGNFDIMVFDDRKDQIDKLLKATINKNVICEVTGDTSSEILGTGRNSIEKSPYDSYVVIMTRGHKNDLLVLREIMKLSKKPRYTGMIGSQHKISAVFSQLESEGVSKEALLSVHAPIGLQIGGDTPGEIAISVMAELVSTRTGGKKGKFPGLHE